MYIWVISFSQPPNEECSFTVPHFTDEEIGSREAKGTAQS